MFSKEFLELNCIQIPDPVFYRPKFIPFHQKISKRPNSSLEVSNEFLLQYTYLEPEAFCSSKKKKKKKDLNQSLETLD